MTLIDFDEVAALGATTTEVLLRHSPIDVVPRLRELGWFEIRSEEPKRVDSIFFDLQGKHLASTELLDVLVSSALAPDMNPGHAAAALHPLPGAEGRPVRLRGSEILDIDGLLITRGDIESLWIQIGADRIGRLTAGALEQLEMTAVEGFDPTLGWRRLRGSLPVQEVTDVTGAPPGGEQAIADLARRALSFELVGVVREMVAIAVDHATERHQFGRPIGSFQAVQHRLAEAKVALEAADQAAQRSLHSDDALVATMAKLLAGEAGRVASRQCQQVLGGMGFTWEHRLHRYVRRALTLDMLYGSSKQLSALVGRQLRTDKRAPILLSL